MRKKICISCDNELDELDLYFWDIYGHCPFCQADEYKEVSVKVG